MYLHAPSLSNMESTIGSKDLKNAGTTAQEFVDWLSVNGAKPAKP